MFVAKKGNLKAHFILKHPDDNIDVLEFVEPSVVTIIAPTTGISCTLCSKKFTRNTNLLYHINHVHNQASNQGTLDRLSCDVCDKTFVNKSALNRHAILYHEQSTICDVCGGNGEHIASCEFVPAVEPEPEQEPNEVIDISESNWLCDRCGGVGEHTASCEFVPAVESEPETEPNEVNDINKSNLLCDMCGGVGEHSASCDVPMPTYEEYSATVPSESALAESIVDTNQYDVTFTEAAIAESAADQSCEYMADWEIPTLFTFIKENKMTRNVAKKLRLPELDVCSCSSNCDQESQCICRNTLNECNEHCYCSNNCTNKQIQNNNSVPVEQFSAAEKGLGIKTKIPIETGSFVVQYVGEVISEAQYIDRLKRAYKDDLHSYAMRIDKTHVIDSHRMGNYSRFINHSCDPNCKIQQWIVNRLHCLALFANRRIAADEELTFDYQFESYSEAKKCYCNSTNCRDFLGKMVT